MKKVLVFTALLLFAGIAFGQTLKKGNLIGVHVVTVELKPDVTMEQYIKFLSEKYIPEFEKLYEGYHLFTMKGIRGENKGSIGFLFQLKDEATRNLYNNDDGSPTDLGNQLWEKFKPVFSEMEKLGTWASDYTDWVIQ